MKIYKYFLLHNKKLKPWIKYWLLKDKNYVLSDILDGTSFYLENSANKNFNLFQINGNSMQDGTPTPTNPVEVKSSGDNGYITEVISNKNLFKIPTTTIKGITCTQLEDGAYCFNGTATADSFFKFALTKEIANGTIHVLSCTSNQTSSKVHIRTRNSSNGLADTMVMNVTSSSITSTKQCSYSEITIQKGAELSNFIVYPQLELGSSATSFVPHQEQNISIPCQQPMRSIGNVRDVFAKENGVWYEKHNLRQRILNGNENWISQTQTGFYRYGLTDSVINNETSYASQIIIKSDSFKGITFNNRNSDTNETIYAVSNGQQHNLFINTKSYTTLNDFKNWLTGNNIEVIYLLNEPIYLECTQEQIQALESIIRAYTYEPITNINSTDETPAFLKIQYYMEV